MHLVSALLGTISIWIILLPALLGLLIVNRLDRDSRLILLAVLAGCAPQVLRPFIHGTALLNLLYNIYTPIEFLIYWMLFSSKIISPQRRTFLHVLALGFLLYSIYLVFSNGLGTRFLNEWVIASNIIQVLALCLCLLDYYFHDDSVINLSQPFFWFLAGITCYAPCTVIFFSLWFYIQNSAPENQIILKNIHHVFNILLYISFTIGMLKNLSPFNVRA
ncbi:MAG TPA: hypothetical protein VGD40_11995 [Chryseosolibacter sp.]